MRGPFGVREDGWWVPGAGPELRWGFGSAFHSSGSGRGPESLVSWRLQQGGAGLASGADTQPACGPLIARG